MIKRLITIALLLTACTLTASPGYVRLDMTRPTTTPEPTPTQEVIRRACNNNAYGVNIRDAPNTTGRVLGVLGAGECLPLANDLSTWWIVWYAGDAGYVAGWLLD